jgi:hypothetical protein
LVAWNFIEHVNNDRRIHIMTEIWRLLRNKGVASILVPDATSGPGAWQDPTHYSYWCEESFKYYTEDEYRNLYGIKAKFKVLEMEKQHVPGNNVDYVYCKLEAVK